MKQEFEQIAGYEVTNDAYYNIIEPMYTATNLTKQEFVKVLDRKAFALPTKGELKKQMRKIAGKIFENCGLRTFHEEEAELDRIAKAYAKRFYGIEWATDTSTWVFFTKEYAYCGIPQDRGCSYPAELVIGRGDYEYERIALVG